MNSLFDEFQNNLFSFKPSWNHSDAHGVIGVWIPSNEEWGPSDIDIHVPGDPRGWEAPDHLRIYDWDKIMKVMKLRLRLNRYSWAWIPKDGLSVEFGSIDSLPDFAGVSESDRVDSSREHHFSCSKFGTVFKYLQGFFPRFLSKWAQ